MKIKIKKTKDGYEVKMITRAGYVYTATGTTHGFMPARVDATGNEALVRKAWKEFDEIVALTASPVYEDNVYRLARDIMRLIDKQRELRRT